MKELLKKKSSFENVIYLGKTLQEITIDVSETDGRHNLQLVTAKDIIEKIQSIKKDEDRKRLSIFT